MIPKDSRLAPLKGHVKHLRADLASRFAVEKYSWPALNALDRKLARILPPSGVFLEVGANDGYSQSNTYFLEKQRRWKGILIEPHPHLYRVAARYRRAECFNLACIAPDGPEHLNLVDQGLMSLSRNLLNAREEWERTQDGNHRTFRVATSTLSAIIDKSSHAAVTFMSIDVEGAELELLRGLDLTRHTPRFLLIETRKLEAVTEALSLHMSVIDQLSHHDYLFATVDQQ